MPPDPRVLISGTPPSPPEAHHARLRLLPKLTPHFSMKPFLFLLLTMISTHANIVEYELTIAEEP
jgi:hypothetical protein